jgi:FAD/FMN-containing dehydrogenase
MTEPPLTRGPDGRFHPRTEAEVSALIRFAAIHGRRLRVRGAGHAPLGTVAVDDERDLPVSLDEMRGLRVVDEAQRIVEAQAGIHLGSDPASGPAGTLETSLLSLLAGRHGWTLSTTGGITHQTLGGYLATASAGGTLQHSLLDEVQSITFVDGRGEGARRLPGRRAARARRGAAEPRSAGGDHRGADPL